MDKWQEAICTVQIPLNVLLRTHEALAGLMMHMIVIGQVISSSLHDCAMISARGAQQQLSDIRQGVARGTAAVPPGLTVFS